MSLLEGVKFGSKTSTVLPWVASRVFKTSPWTFPGVLVTVVNLSPAQTQSPRLSLIRGDCSGSLIMAQLSQSWGGFGAIPLHCAAGRGVLWRGGGLLIPGEDSLSCCLVLCSSNFGPCKAELNFELPALQRCLRFLHNPYGRCTGGKTS